MASERPDENKLRITSNASFGDSTANTFSCDTHPKCSYPSFPNRESNDNGFGSCDGYRCETINHGKLYFVMSNQFVEKCDLIIWVSDENNEDDNKQRITIHLKDLIAVKRYWASKTTRRASYIQLFSHRNSFRPFFFPSGGSNACLDELKKYVSLFEDVNNRNNFIVLSDSIMYPLQDQPGTPLSLLGGVQSVLEYIRKNTFGLLSSSITNIFAQYQRRAFSLDFDEFTVFSSKSDAPQRIMFDTEQKPLTSEQFNSLKETDGSFSEESENKIKSIIFSGGISDEAYKAVFPFLLKRYSWRSSEQIREQIKAQTRERYRQLKLQWTSMDEDQLLHCTLFKKYQDQIIVDCKRTDRKTDFFSNTEQGEHHIRMLEQLLFTYMQYNQDLRYMQGMSDIAGTFLFVTLRNVIENEKNHIDNEEDETEAFWWFYSFMEQYHENFAEHSSAMFKQLQVLLGLLEIVSPPLAKHIRSLNCANLIFCVDWILLIFKRQVDNNEEFLRVLSSVLTFPHSKYFVLFLAASVILSYGSEILEKNYSENDLLELFYIKMRISNVNTLILNGIDAANRLLTPSSETEVYQKQQTLINFFFAN